MADAKGPLAEVESGPALSPLRYREGKKSVEIG